MANNDIPMMGSLSALKNRIFNPMTMAGLSILGSPSRDVNAGLRTGLEFAQNEREQAAMDQRSKMQQQAMAEDEAQKAAYRGLLDDPANLANLPPEVQRIAKALPPQKGAELLLETLQKRTMAEDPSNIREWQAYQKMTPEQRTEFLNMKRANNQIVGDTLISKATGAPVANVGEALARGEQQKMVGEMRGKQQASAPADMDAATTALDMVQSIRTDPAKARGTGMTSIGNVIPGTSGYGFQRKVDQATSGAFLTAIQQMRGLGSLSNAEGQTATAAVTRLSTGLSEGDFNKALDDYESIVRRGLANAAKRIPSSAIGGGEPQSTPQGWGLKKIGD